MGASAYVHGYRTQGQKTETAGTIIQVNVPGHDGQTLALLRAQVITQGTAHLLSLLHATGTGTRTTAAQAEASGQATLLCADEPKDPAGNAAASGDHIAYQLSDGSWEFNTVSSLSTADITLNNNIGSPGIAAGGKVRVFGVVGDGAAQKLSLVASTTNDYHASGDIVLVHPYAGDPWIVQIDNGTAASTIRFLTFAYINKPGGFE